jgi:hypothetical protein
MRAAIAVTLLAALGGCTDRQAVGDELVRALASSYPGQITAISFENHPPLDPPTLFIDLAESMTDEAKLHFICDVVVPRVDAAGGHIAVASFWTDDDCR